MVRNIMLAIVSKTNEQKINEPVTYPDIQGAPYEAIHTNEACTVYLERKYQRLDRIFFLTSKAVEQEQVHDGTERTHIKFLCDRLEAQYPNIWQRVEQCQYGRKDEILDEIAQIANRVSNYADTVPGDTLVVHADMTGGFRYTSMMMLAIMQLLKYRRITLGEVLYADMNNKNIYDATPIQRMFDLINGADEFVRFGSVQSLQAYFDGMVNQDVSLQRLLEGMQCFSDAVKICSTASIEQEVRQLGERLADFQRSPHASLKARMLENMVATIRAEYGRLLEPDVSRLDIIRWCLNKGFWQQVMTLCTEWIPYYLVDKKIAYTDDEAVKELCRKHGEDMQREWQQDFIIAYSGTGSVVGDRNAVQLKVFLDNLRIAISQAKQGIWKAIPHTEREQPPLTGLIGELNTIITKRKSKGIVAQPQDLQARHPFLHQLLSLNYKFQRRKNIYYRKSFAELLTMLQRSDYLERLLNLPHEVWHEFMGEKFNTSNAKTTKAKEQLQDINNSMVTYWDSWHQKYKYFYESGLYETKLSLEEMLECLKGYRDIHYWRNQINHANGHEVIDIKEFSQYISKYLDMLESLGGRDKS